jgi:DNA-binding NarL/FixJ family response regulator
VVLSTGYSTDGDVRDLIALGALGVIQKPYTLENLAATLGAILGDADG